MPYVHVRITPDGATRERKARVIQAITGLLVRELDKKPEETFVIIEQVPPDNWGIAGESATVRRARGAAR